MASSTALRALLHGFIAGNLASFVKWGAEVPLPPRDEGRSVPPVEMLRAVGLDADRLTFRYSGYNVNYGAVLVHQVFSVTAAMLYATCLNRNPSLGRDRGTRFGLAVTALFHAVILPAGRWAPPVWRQPIDELVSETVGHLLWSWTIDLALRGLAAAHPARDSVERASSKSRV